MMKGFFLLAAVLGMMVFGTVSATGREPVPKPESDYGACKFYCGSKAYDTLAQCAAVCGGPSECDQVC